VTVSLKSGFLKLFFKKPLKNLKFGLLGILGFLQPTSTALSWSHL